ncbi:MAG TPA: CAP domain-containing protein, partial [Chitinophagaceae bacterium]|nr:CAP domain-containing protein [Chitinophagaceae bacterium]
MLKTNFLRCTFIFSIISLFSFTSERSLTDGITEDVFKYTNQFRRSKGLKALEMRNDLNVIARKHSEDMA